MNNDQLTNGHGFFKLQNHWDFWTCLFIQCLYRVDSICSKIASDFEVNSFALMYLTLRLSDSPILRCEYLRMRPFSKRTFYIHSQLDKWLAIELLHTIVCICQSVIHVIFNRCYHICVLSLRRFAFFALNLTIRYAL